MKRILKITTTFSLALMLGIVFMSVTSNKSMVGGPWVAPKSADTIVNHFKNDAQATAEGKKLYTQMCAVCHGDKGKGDGVGAAGLTPRPADHTSAAVQAQSDGAIFWKLTYGRAPMAAYEKILTPKQRWAVVNYIRTLKKVSK